jgi:hypothetical protein
MSTYLDYRPTTPPTRTDLDTCPDCRMTRNMRPGAACGKHVRQLLAAVERQGERLTDTRPGTSYTDWERW